MEIWKDMQKINLGNVAENCILFVCDHFLTFGEKCHFPEVYTIFLWSIFRLFCKKGYFPRSVYYLFVIHFWTFEAKSHFPEVYTVFCDPFLDDWVKSPKMLSLQKCRISKNAFFIIEDVVRNPKFEMLEFFCGLILV